jgi:hypothetical protein
MITDYTEVSVMIICFAQRQLLQEIFIMITLQICFLLETLTIIIPYKDND